MRYMTMKTMALAPFDWPPCCRACDSQKCIARIPVFHSSDSLETVIFMAAYMYPTEVFGVMPKEAKDCINALIKVADEDKLGIDLILMVPDLPPVEPKSFWERLKNKLLAICGGHDH